jgi:uncharacterized protein
MGKGKGKKEQLPSWGGLLARKREMSGEEAPENTEGFKEERLFVTGMTCTSCQVRIERALSLIDGVSSAAVSYADSSAVVLFDPVKTSRDAFVDAVTKLGYGVKSSGKSFTLPQLLGIGAVVAVIFLLLSQSGIFSLVPQIDKNASYWILLVTGVLTSVHCVGMCGAINISQSMKTVSGEGSGPKRLIPGILYNGGRVISYTLIGGIVGAIGSAISFSKNVQAVIIVVAGAFMLLMGLNILGVLPFLKRFQLRLPNFINRRVAGFAGGKSPFIVGLLNGLMPCGPLQSMQLYALGSGSFVNGAISMFFFSLGTVPLVPGIGALSSVLNKRFAMKMIKVSAILVFFLGIGMIVRGLSLSGINVVPIGGNEKNLASIRGDVQVVSTTLKAGSYEPITVYAGIPVKWTISAEESEINGCNSPMTIPTYNITKTFSPGENLVEFTPAKPGDITFTCWMGMITSSIKVLPNPNGGEAIASNGSENLDPANPVVPTLPPTTGIGSGDKSGAVVASLEGGVQIVSTELGARGYPSFIVQKGIPVKWTFSATQSNLTSCNSRFVIPDLRIEKELVQGDNLIEFTPKKTGLIQYTCWMRMIRAAIYVVSDLNDGASIASAKDALKNLPPASGGGCCSANTPQSVQTIDPANLPLGVARIESGVQTVTTDLGPWGYTPLVIQKGIPVRWKFNADPKYLSSCNYRFIIPELKIRKELSAGENLIEFTPPDNEAALQFTCWMRMVQSAVFVLDDINDAATIEKIRAQWVEYATSGGKGRGGGGCCGG